MHVVRGRSKESLIPSLETRMRHFFAVGLVAAAFALTGCAANTDSSSSDGDQQLGEESSAISGWGKKLVGAWEVQKGSTFDFDDLVLKSDGTYLWHRNIMCKMAPCPTD